MAKRPSGTQGDVDGLVIAGGDTGGADFGDGNSGSGNGTGIDGLVIVDPAEFGSGSGDSGSSGDTTGKPERKRRGRAPGSTRTQKARSLDINGVEGILYSAHAILAGMSKTPELALDKTEANELAKAISAVSAHYDVAATEKTMAWTSLLMAAGMIYGTRLVAIRARKNREPKAQRPTPSPVSGGGNIIEIPGVGKVDVGQMQ